VGKRIGDDLSRCLALQAIIADAAAGQTASATLNSPPATIFNILAVSATFPAHA
jgi:hypothetical protein